MATAFFLILGLQTFGAGNQRGTVLGQRKALSLAGKCGRRQMAVKGIGLAIALWLALGATSWANSFTYLAPDGTIMTASPGQASLVDESCPLGPFSSIGCVTDHTNDAPFKVTNSRGTVSDNATWFTFIGSNNGIFRARSVCSYAHNGDKIVCDWAWESVPAGYTSPIQHQMSLFDGNGNCTLISLSDVSGRSGTPAVSQVPNPDPGCQKPNVAPHS
jgi:hypothetical protein